MATLAFFSLTGTALALYCYSSTASSGSKRKDSNADPASSSSVIDTHLSLYRAPTSFFEDLYFFVEGLRFFYGETLFKWKTADLLFGLYYVCQNNGAMSVRQLADVGQAGTVFGLEAVASGDTERIRKNTIFLQRMERCFRYNSCLRERRPMYRKRRILQRMNIEERDFLEQATSAGVLKPSYVLVRDHELKNIVLMIRGTHSVKDAFTSLTGASKPHHVVDSNGVTLGYSHFGMLAAARWLKGELMHAFEDALRNTPGYPPLIIGHSLGGGAAAMLTMMLREQGGMFEDAQCLAIACPACMTMELAESCRGYVTTVVNGCDAIPMMSSGSADGLREEVMTSEWYDEFHRDMRQYKLFRAFEKTKRWVRGKGETMNICGAEQGELVARAKVAMDRAMSVSERWVNLIGWSRWNGYLGGGAGGAGVAEGDHVLDDHHPGNDDGTRNEDQDSSFLIQGSREHATESLEAEASWRRKAVRDAVLNAEAEERQRSSCNDHDADPHVPSIIRPGNYGDQGFVENDRHPPLSSPSSSPSRGRSWKRFMYPAGRIMHFVPAHVVPGYENSVIEDEEPFVESPMDDIDDIDCNVDAGVGGDPSTLGVRAPRTFHEREPSELGLEHIMGGEGSMLHHTSASDSHDTEGPLPPLKPAPGPPPKNMILVDNVPQSLYGRMRPSTTILSDHVIPNYMRSLHSFRKRHWF